MCTSLASDPYLAAMASSSSSHGINDDDTTAPGTGAYTTNPPTYATGTLHHNLSAQPLNLISILTLPHNYLHPHFYYTLSLYPFLVPFRPPGLGTVGWISPITRAAVLADRNEQQGLGLGPGSSSAQGRGLGLGRKLSAKKMRAGSMGLPKRRGIFEGDEGEENGLEDDEEDEVGWDEPRCHLRMVALGSMDLAQRAGAGTHTTLLPPNYYPSNLYEDERADESMMAQLRLLSQYAGNNNTGEPV